MAGTVYITYIYIMTQVSFHTQVHDVGGYRTACGLMEVPPGAGWGFSNLPVDTWTCRLQDTRYQTTDSLTGG